MINIEKEFYTRMEEKFSECKSVAFHLVEYGALTTTKMEQYLIKCDYKEAKKKTKNINHIIYSELAAKYSKAFDSIKYIIEKT